MTHEVLCDKILRICGVVIGRYREKVYAHYKIESGRSTNNE